MAERMNGEKRPSKTRVKMTQALRCFLWCSTWRNANGLIWQ